MTNWLLLAQRATDVVGTPCYVMSESEVREALVRLNSLQSSVRLRHWVSLKTQPVPRLVQSVTAMGLGIDVVSEFELASIVGCNVAPERILVNGVGKHSWLPGFDIPGLSVHFDSLAEVKELGKVAAALRWQVGLRCAIPLSDQSDDGLEAFGFDQFGMTVEELQEAAASLASAGVTVSGMHFSLHTNVRCVSEYRRALSYAACAVVATGIVPRYVDIGGGLPVAGETPLNSLAPKTAFALEEFKSFIASIPSVLPSVREIWLENGRFLTGPSGALIITVLDKKERGDGIYLVCDGGRVNHARMASIEQHEILLVPPRQGPLRKTIVCGPTCSSVDHLGCWMLPESVVPGDQVIWLTAGAYHIPLETRFSTGVAPVVWFNERNELEIIRQREAPAQWWEHWICTTESSAHLTDQAVQGR